MPKIMWDRKELTAATLAAMEQGIRAAQEKGDLPKELTYGRSGFDLILYFGTGNDLKRFAKFRHRDQ